MENKKNLFIIAGFALILVIVVVANIIYSNTTRKKTVASLMNYVNTIEQYAVNNGDDTYAATTQQLVSKEGSGCSGAGACTKEGGTKCKTSDGRSDYCGPVLATGKSCKCEPDSVRSIVVPNSPASPSFNVKDSKGSAVTPKYLFDDKSQQCYTQIGTNKIYDSVKCLSGQCVSYTGLNACLTPYKKGSTTPPNLIMGSSGGGTGWMGTDCLSGQLDPAHPGACIESVSAGRVCDGSGNVCGGNPCACGSTRVTNPTDAR